MRKLLLVVGLVVSLSGCGGSSDSSAPSASLAQGKKLYDLNCKSCHGAEGHGDGPSAGVFKPPLRDFAKHPWRTSPDRETIKKSIVEGVPGTQMPMFKSFSPADLDALVDFTLSLAPKGPPPKEQTKARDFGKFGFVAVEAKRAPGLDIFDEKHHRLTLDEWVGTWRVVHFWSKGNKSLLEDLKCLQALADELKSIRFVLIGGDENDPDELAIAAEKAITSLPIYSVRNRGGLEPFEITSLPVTLLIDPEGNLLARKEGNLDEGKLRELLTTIMV